MDYTFEDYWSAMQPASRYDDRKTAAEIEWNCHPEKHAAIMAWLKKRGAYSERNPYFFIQDFTLKKESPQPVFLRGDEQGVDIVQVKYNDRFKLCSRETMNLFNLQWIKDWSSPS